MTGYATPRQISFIRDLRIERGLTPDLDYGTLTKAAASQAITALKATPRLPKATAHTTSERRDNGTGTTVYVVDHTGKLYDTIVVNDWMPAHSGPVPGHSCADGCCGLQVDFATYDELRGTVEGIIM